MKNLIIVLLVATTSISTFSQERIGFGTSARFALLNSPKGELINAQILTLGATWKKFSLNAGYLQNSLDLQGLMISLDYQLIKRPLVKKWGLGWGSKAIGETLILWKPDGTTLELYSLMAGVGVAKKITRRFSLSVVTAQGIQYIPDLAGWKRTHRAILIIGYRF
jgi:hypothetical protein